MRRVVIDVPFLSIRYDGGSASIDDNADWYDATRPGRLQRTFRHDPKFRFCNLASFVQRDGQAAAGPHVGPRLVDTPEMCRLLNRGNARMRIFEEPDYAAFEQVHAGAVEQDMRLLT